MRFFLIFFINGLGGEASSGALKIRHWLVDEYIVIGDTGEKSIYF
jgi:hypothetical protein